MGRYQWDHRGRLTQVTQFNSTLQAIKKIDYAYDALDRRIGEQVSIPGTEAGTWVQQSATGFVYDGARQLLAVDLTGTNNGVVRSNYYGPVGELNAVDVALGDTVTGATHTAWTFADPAGTLRSVARLDAANGWMFLHRHTDEFGNLYATDGDSAALSDGYLNGVPLYISGFERDAKTGLYLAGSRWYDSTSGRFLTTSGNGDGGGYAFVPVNPMDLANGYLPTGPSLAGDWDGELGYWHYFRNGWAAQGFRALGNFERGMGDWIASPLTRVANSSESPTLAATAGFLSGVIQLPYDIVGGLVDIPGLTGGVHDSFSAYYEKGGGGVYGTLLGISGTIGVASAAESYYQHDILTGRQLTGDEVFDRGVIGAGAIGGIILGGYQTSLSLSARVANAAKNGSRIAGLLNSQIPTVGKWVDAAGKADLLYLPKAFIHDLRYAPRRGSLNLGLFGIKPKSLREQFLGRTPGKGSRTGRQVIERMQSEGGLRWGANGGAEVRYIEPVTGTESWHPLASNDMGHLHDAVRYWNETGRYLGPKHPDVRKWMLDPTNYELQPSSINRAIGAGLPDRYLPPAGS